MAANDLWAIERRLRAEGFDPICGCDEAGAGPLAGPVFAAAVILPFGLEIEGLDDSKKLSEKKRDQLFDIITKEAVAYAVASVDEEKIDAINILNARLKAMDLAICNLPIKAAFALIDGNRSSGISMANEAITGGDGRCASIAAASILAKVSRDRYMMEMANHYPGYGFEKHKGYGTKLHYEALRVLGPCPIHRLTFLKKIH